tara:strand:- start:1676 stop:2215 length:540 start_codon:yes stop_codon:yes gene_type:complete
MNKKIKNSGIFGILILILTFPLLLLEFLKTFMSGDENFVMIYVISLLIYLLIFIFFIRGFILIGKKLKIPLLVNLSYLTIIVNTIWTIFQIFTPIYPQLTNLFYQILVLLTFGIIIILFGISLLKLEKKFGSIAKATGILNIIAGISFVTVILSFIGLLLIIPISILEIILLFRASKKL